MDFPLVDVWCMKCCKKNPSHLDNLIRTIEGPKKQLDIPTFICVSFFVIHVAPICVAVGVICRPLETTNVLNSWPQILSCLQRACGGESFHYRNRLKYSRVSACLKIIALTALLAFGTVSAAVWSVVFTDLPIMDVKLAASGQVWRPAASGQTET